MKKKAQFIESQFQLDPEVAGYSFNPEVACTIANVLHARNRPGQKANDFPADTPVLIDLMGTKGTHAPESNLGDKNTAYRISFKPNPSNLEGLNSVFGAEMQRVMDEAERTRRRPVKSTFAISAIYAAVCATPAAAVFSSAATETRDDLGYMAASGGLLVFAGSYGITAAQNICRRVITNPEHIGLYEDRLYRTAELVASLELPPILQYK